jgi:hypothetical protein
MRLNYCIFCPALGIVAVYPLRHASNFCELYLWGLFLKDTAFSLLLIAKQFNKICTGASPQISTKNIHFQLPNFIARKGAK